MKVLITGAGGQLAAELLHTAPPEHELVALTRAELDVSDEAAITAVLARHRPEAVINTAAYTRVDEAEDERAAAFAVNADGAGWLAEAAAALDAAMIQVSTDFVFGDGSGVARRPDEVVDAGDPLGVYGASKLEGEKRVTAATGGSALVVRTAWLYSRHGRNFVTAMLERMRDGRELAVVADQIGTPTWARGLARALWRGLARGIAGVQHWTDAGVASWYDFAVAIQDEAQAFGLLAQPVAIRPIASGDYPTRARRPAFCVLDKTRTWEALETQPVHWRRALRIMLAELQGDTASSRDG